MGKSNKTRRKIRRKKRRPLEEFQKALFTQGRARNFSEQVQAHNGRAIYAEEKLQTMVPCGIWEHWKSTPSEPKFYVAGRVLCEMEGEAEPIVPLTALYLPHAGKRVSRILLGKAGFLVPVRKKKKIGGRVYAGPRFRLVRQLHPIQGTLIEEAARSLAKPGYSRTELLKAIEDCMMGVPV